MRRSLPVSIAVHLVVLVLFLIIPLTAEVTLPSPAVRLPDYVRAMSLPAPPPAPVRPAVSASAPGAAVRPAAPVVAPAAITPEALPVGPPETGLPPSVGEGVPSEFMGGGGGARPVELPPPPPPVRPAGPVRVAELPAPPRKIVDARPVYPDVARAARIEGTVVLEAVIDRTGRIAQVHVVTSVPLLDQAALDAVRQWRYSPSVYNGHPVSVLMTVTVRFFIQ